MTKLYIDCEWNSYKGALISMALVSEDGSEWYEEILLEADAHYASWVVDNVVPHLHKKPLSRAEMQESLEIFLSKYADATIIADWPEDIERFCELLITGPGEKIKTPKLSMRIEPIEAYSKVPHYALEDARGLAVLLKKRI